MKKIALIVIAMNLILAQGETAVPFLLISPNAHSSALGEAGVSFPVDPSLAMHFNVAGLAYQHKINSVNPDLANSMPVNFSFAEWLPNLNLNDLWIGHFATRYHIDGFATTGFSVRYLNLGTVITTDEQGTQTGEYEASELEFSAAISDEVFENFFVGAAVKYIYSGITRSDVVVGAEKTEPGNSIAIDLAMFQIWELDFLSFNEMNLGVSWNNIGPSISYKDNAQSDPLPIILRGGIGLESNTGDIDYGVNYEIGIITVERTISNSSVLQRFNHSISAYGTVDELFSLRSGIFLESERYGDRKFLTFGVGLNTNYFVLDGSYLTTISTSVDSKNHPLEGTIRFSLLLNL